MKNDSSNISPEVIAQLKSYVYDIIGCCQDVHRERLLQHFSFSMFFSEVKRNVVFPRMLSLVAKQRVMRAGLVQELALKHKALASVRKLVERKTADEGF